MFGLENKKKKPVLFEFDLEKEMHDDKKQQHLLKEIETHIQEIKKTLREGAKDEDFEKLGYLLHGYSALLKVVVRITSTK